MGWTLGSSTIHPFREKGQLYSHLSLAAVHIFLVLWEQWWVEGGGAGRVWRRYLDSVWRDLEDFEEFLVLETC